MSYLIGQHLGVYQISEQIGQGGMATVFKATDPTNGRLVAIKVLPRHFNQNPGFASRFEREAPIIAGLNHPHIVSVYDYGRSDDGTAYLVMAYIEGDTLADRLKVGMPFTEAYYLFPPIGQAVAYAHQQGMIHRDLKPSNVLIDQHHHVFVADFGLAQMMTGDSSLTASLIMGTPAYMSPEQGEGRPADKRSDIYTLGIILYEMTTGQRPFEAETPMAVMLKQLTDILVHPRQLNPDLTPEVEQIILKALAKNPDDRYQSAAQMTRELQVATGVQVDTALAGSQAAATVLPSSPYTSQPDPDSAQPAASSARSFAGLWLVLGLIILLLVVGLVCFALFLT
jgi:serine/threonine-protein kinase